jgi:hypothetical protein
LGVTAKEMHPMLFIFMQDYYKHKNIEHILILSGDQLYRMDYMELVQVGDILVVFFLLLFWLPNPLAYIICRNMLMTMQTLLYHVLLLERGITIEDLTLTNSSSFSLEIVNQADLLLFVLKAGHLTMD